MPRGAQYLLGGRSHRRGRGQGHGDNRLGLGRVVQGRQR